MKKKLTACIWYEYGKINYFFHISLNIYFKQRSFLYFVVLFYFYLKIVYKMYEIIRMHWKLLIQDYFYNDLLKKNAIKFIIK